MELIEDAFKKACAQARACLADAMACLAIASDGWRSRKLDEVQHAMTDGKRETMQALSSLSTAEALIVAEWGRRVDAAVSAHMWLPNSEALQRDWALMQRKLEVFERTGLWPEGT